MKILNLVILVSTLVACGKTQSSESATRGVLEGQKKSPNQVADLAYEVGFRGWEIDMMVCIARHESEFYTAAYNDNGGGNYDQGLFQINDIHWPLCGISHYSELNNSVTNARCAYKVYRERQQIDASGDGFTAWTTYSSCR